MLFGKLSRSQEEPFDNIDKMLRMTCAHIYAGLRAHIINRAEMILLKQL
jgi:hypothetical protein